MPRVAKDPELEKFEGEQGIVARWVQEVELVETSPEQQAFERNGERIAKKYKNAQGSMNFDVNFKPQVEYNTLWSNVQVLSPCLFARLPKVVVERFWKSSDPVSLLASEICQDATQFNMDIQKDKTFYNIRQCVQDVLLPGRGQGQVVFRVDFEDMTDEQGNPIVDDNGIAKKQVKPNSERVEFEHINYADYLESKARTQYEVRWRSRKLYYTHQEATEEFGEDVAEGLDYSSNPYSKKKKNEEVQPDFLEQAVVYRIEDLTTKECLYISPGYRQKPLKKAKNPLKLKDFYSFPIPLLATTTSDSTYPVADFIIYESLANELDYVVQRLGAMTDCVRLVGMVASERNKDIKEMLRLDDGNLLPVTGWQQFMDKGGLAAMVNWLPFEQAVNAIPVLQERFGMLKAQIDEITSMPDFVRGSSDPNEPIANQQRKAQWVMIKLVNRQQDVQRFCREIAAKMAEIIFEPGFFSDETIWLMSGMDQKDLEKQNLFYPALQLLRDDRLRTFKIDIETDSTIAQDNAANAEAFAQYFQGLNGIFSSLQPIMQFRPELMTPVIQTAKEAVNHLRTGRATQAAWDKALDEIAANDKAAKENPQPPPPDPLLIRAQNEQAKIRQDGQFKMQEMQLEGQKFQFETWLEQQKLMQESQKNEGELAVKHEANMIDAQEQLTRGQIDKIIADMDIFQAELKNKIEGEKVRINALLEAERLEWEKKVKLIEVQEKILEEKRMAGDQALEHKRMLLEHRQAMTEAKESAKASKGSDSSGGSGSNTQPFNIVLNTDQPITLQEQKKPRKRRHKIKRLPTGEFEGESEDVEDEKVEVTA